MSENEKDQSTETIRDQVQNWLMSEGWQLSEPTHPEFAWLIRAEDGGSGPARRTRAPGVLSFTEREEVSRGLAAGVSLRRPRGNSSRRSGRSTVSAQARSTSTLSRAVSSDRNPRKP